MSLRAKPFSTSKYMTSICGASYLQDVCLFISLQLPYFFKVSNCSITLSLELFQFYSLQLKKKRIGPKKNKKGVQN